MKGPLYMHIDLDLESVHLPKRRVSMQRIVLPPAYSLLRSVWHSQTETEKALEVIRLVAQLLALAFLRRRLSKPRCKAGKRRATWKGGRGEQCRTVAHMSRAVATGVLPLMHCERGGLLLMCGGDSLGLLKLGLLRGSRKLLLLLCYVCYVLLLLEKALLVSPVVQLVVELHLLFCGQMLSLLHELTEQSLRMLLNLGVRRRWWLAVLRLGLKANELQVLLLQLLRCLLLCQSLNSGLRIRRSLCLRELLSLLLILLLLQLCEGRLDLLLLLITRLWRRGVGQESLKTAHRRQTRGRL